MYTRSNLEQVLYLIVISNCALISVVVLTVFILQVDKVALLLNFGLHFLKSFQNMYMPSSKSNKNLNKKLLHSIWVSMVYFVFCILMFSCPYFLFPQSCIYFTGELKAFYLSKLLYVSFGILVCTIMFTVAMSTLLALVLILFSYTLMAPIICNEFKMGKAVKSRHSKDTLHKPPVFTKM